MSIFLDHPIYMQFKLQSMLLDLLTSIQPLSASAFNMISLKPHDEPLFTMVSVYSLLGVIALLAVAHFSGKALLPAKTRKFDQAVFVWLVCWFSSRFTGMELAD